VLLQISQTATGGGSVWDYAATTACLFQEIDMPVSDMEGKLLVLNPRGPLS
jgi:hypothetical protein